jgi:uncharacterized protein YndB with AHSA1/START domain
METTNNDRIRVEVDCDFNVDSTSVFNAWLDPKMIEQWMFGKTVRDEAIVKLENNPKEGGQFSYVVKRGEDILNHTGTYLEIRPYSKLVFTWGIGEEQAKESVVSITITPHGNGCHLSLVHEMDKKWESYKTRTRDGWTFMLNKLKSISASSANMSSKK